VAGIANDMEQRQDQECRSKLRFIKFRLKCVKNTTIKNALGNLSTWPAHLSPEELGRINSALDYRQWYIMAEVNVLRDELGLHSYPDCDEIHVESHRSQGFECCDPGKENNNIGMDDDEEESVMLYSEGNFIGPDPQFPHLR